MPPTGLLLDALSFLSGDARSLFRSFANYLVTDRRRSRANAGLARSASALFGVAFIRRAVGVLRAKRVGAQWT
jgi:hypothetical protein